VIDLYTFKTPNGRKVSVALEEMELPYRVHSVDIGKNEQMQPSFLALNINHKIPVIVDPEGPGGAPITLSESGAILVYLAEKTGKFLPAARRYEILQWVMFQMSAVGPIFGQSYHFAKAAPEKIPYAIERFLKEAARITGVLDQRLAANEFLAGDYSIADMITYPWVAPFLDLLKEQGEFANVRRWVATVGGRPAVARGMVVPA
jgi:GST-like protein